MVLLESNRPQETICPTGKKDQPKIWNMNDFVLKCHVDFLLNFYDEVHVWQFTGLDVQHTVKYPGSIHLTLTCDLFEIGHEKCKFILI